MIKIKSTFSWFYKKDFNTDLSKGLKLVHLVVGSFKSHGRSPNSGIGAYEGED